ncbi:LOW QUALITY PROTEIN: zinc finger and BTB domain-containing protein 24-like [Cottoperca gobio]|uniref:LOW QUALITY PROTEIN: zinc finger and BTB domain-containing protein 24-like n=1 Tax=Cottoperca gobio TaxID=56716 RepID=A0A6J2PAD2_COTGO|nr:LOW QUALITY PROTEIN: zinc finger and BTB domain-containing protein 24-like [Cottoperca gobio]
MSATCPLVSLHSHSHQQSILSRFNELRRRDVLCDVTLVVEDVHFKAHRVLLAASSEHFSVMFRAEPQSGQATCRLHGVSAEMFAAVLEFIYSAQVSVLEGASPRLLAAARLMEVSDLVEALTELPRSAEEATGEEAKVDAPEVPDLSKRRRGRPKKNVAEPEGRGAACGRSEDEQCAEAATDSQPKDETDYNPGLHQSRQSKRKIRPPVKYKSYKVSSDTAGSREPGKRGRKRKYPRTEARCDDCSKVFKNHLFLKIHQRTHTGEKPFQCLVCVKAFTQKHTLQVHQRMHTGEKPFVCNVCCKALSTKHALQEHMNLHQGYTRYTPWDKCGKKFHSEEGNLKSHYRVHTGKSLPECVQCHHKFMDTAQLKKHLRTHTGEKPFTCEICGKCFTAKSTLQTHIRIHRGEKPYDCSLCNKSFSDPSARRRHVSSHSGKKPFTCSFCSLSFTRLDNLKTHTKSHNKERAAPSEEAAAPPEDVRNILQLQPYQLPPSCEQEIQLVVTGDDINFVPGQNQEILITEGQAAAPSRLTLLTQSAGNVAQSGGVDPSSHIQTLSVLEGPAQQPEQMHVITLSKEAMQHLQAHHGPPQPLHVAQRPVQQLQVLHQPLTVDASQGPGGREQHGQAIHISSQSSQPISISQTSEQISSHHIQGQTFQIQAGTVSYLYTTGDHS